MTKRNILYTSFLLFILLLLVAVKSYANGIINEPENPIISANKTPLKIDVVIKKQVGDLEQRVKDLEEKASKIDNIEKRISKIKVENEYSKLLNKISEKILKAPNVIWSIILPIIAIVVTILIAVLTYFFKNLRRDFQSQRKDLERNFESEKEKLINAEKEIKESSYKEVEKARKDFDERIKKNTAETEEIKEDLYSIIFDYCMDEAFRKWEFQTQEGYEKAIIHSEKALKYAELKWGKEPVDPKNKNMVNKLKSELAYYYVDAKQKENAGQAINFAKIGLETGININDIHLIDNYLYVIMKFSKLPEDKKKWVEIYETYKEELNAIDDASLPAPIKEEYKKYYDLLKKS